MIGEIIHYIGFVFCLVGGFGFAKGLLYEGNYKINFLNLFMATKKELRIVSLGIWLVGGLLMMVTA